MKKAGILLLALALSLILGCSSFPIRQSGDLEGTSWSLVQFGANAPLPDTAVTAIFEEGQVSGSASCNHYFGTYQAAGDRLTITGLAWTEMACMNPEGIMEQEQQVMGLLGKTQSYRVEGEDLILITSAGDELIFSPLETDPLSN